MKLPQLGQQLRLGLVDGKLFPLDVYRGGRIPLSGQQHPRSALIEAEKNRARLESFGRRRVGVVGHGLERATPIAEPLPGFLEIHLRYKKKKVKKQSCARAPWESRKLYCGCFAASAKNDNKKNNLPTW